MSPQEAFGPNLRRLRIQRGITLAQIAEETKVSAHLWDGLERNHFDRWPTGIFARAWVREYARLIGADPETTVDDFCRWFPQGDRRVLRVVREQAEIVGHQLAWREQLPAGSSNDRRETEAEAAASRQARLPLVSLFLRLRRTLGKA